jgi:hypothetical protein
MDRNNILSSPSELKRHDGRIPCIILYECLPKRCGARLGNGLKCEPKKTRYGVTQQAFRNLSADSCNKINMVRVMQEEQQTEFLVWYRETGHLNNIFSKNTRCLTTSVLYFERSGGVCERRGFCQVEDGDTVARIAIGASHPQITAG